MKQHPQGFNKSQSNEVHMTLLHPPTHPSLYHNDGNSTWQDWGFLEAPWNPQPWPYNYINVKSRLINPARLINPRCSHPKKCDLKTDGPWINKLFGLPPINKTPSAEIHFFNPKFFISNPFCFSMFFIMFHQSQTREILAIKSYGFHEIMTIKSYQIQWNLMGSMRF